MAASNSYRADSLGHIKVEIHVGRVAISTELTCNIRIESLKSIRPHGEPLALEPTRCPGLGLPRGYLKNFLVVLRAKSDIKVGNPANIQLIGEIKIDERLELHLFAKLESDRRVGPVGRVHRVANPVHSFVASRRQAKVDAKTAF